MVIFPKCIFQSAFFQSVEVLKCTRLFCDGHILRDAFCVTDGRIGYSSKWIEVISRFMEVISQFVEVLFRFLEVISQFMDVLSQFMEVICDN